MNPNPNTASLRPIVMKFGGTSLGSAERINQAARLVMDRRSEHPVVVTSAMSQVTNLLIATAEAALMQKKSVVKKNLKTLKEKHHAVAQTKRIQNEIDALLEKLTALYEGIQLLKELTPRTLDYACSFGERMSSWLMEEALELNGIQAQRCDSRSFVQTDDQFGAAEIEWKTTERKILKTLHPLIEQNIIPVVTGYIGATTKDDTTTLGRGGSDYSGAILGVCLNAREIQIWTDVDGMMTADPRLVGEAKMIPEISFQEAAELAYFGAKVLHPKTIQPAVERNIPVRILNTMNPKNPGTTIVEKTKKNGHTIKALSLKRNISVINICSSRMLGPYGFLAKIFTAFERHCVPVDVLATTEVSVSVTVEDRSFDKTLLKELGAFATVKIIAGQTLISIVGEGLKDDYRVEQMVFDTLAHEQIPNELISKGASQINLTLIVKSEHAERAFKALHRRFFEQ